MVTRLSSLTAFGSEQLVRQHGRQGKVEGICAFPSIGDFLLSLGYSQFK